ncbi:sodium:calcium antiporter [Candidatus Nitrosotenuis sp. DW1]|uniref:sodium:calcium antiporter n=1 Tax=Candidatus Nitrosotenuis sp. DW1 TaxID=2259672 RepID=UPI0015CE5863|nr:sodium:calcium antiporter [Candidatus Nitrosotenuis sp. DW1]QLH09262.1 sodium:calcium antiporter [Candidatus Nitrosotenuis sp. DW1]
MSELIIDLVLLIVFLAVLVKSANFAIDSISKFSKRTGIGELAAGFIIVAISTSTPELSVAVFSIHTENVGITLGDIFGSNVTNIALVAAIFLLLSPVKMIEKKTLKNFLPLLLSASAIPALLLLVQTGSKFIGILLLAVFGFFIYYIFKNNPKDDYEQIERTGSIYNPLICFFIGIGLVIFSAKMIVDSASAIALSSGIREAIIGSTIVALGTSLPELTVDIAAVRKKHLSLALGDIIGSCIINITLVLGLVLVLTEIHTNFIVLSTLVGFALLSPMILLILLRKGKIRRIQSAIMLAIYASFLLMSFELHQIDPISQLSFTN